MHSDKTLLESPVGRPNVNLVKRQMLDLQSMLEARALECCEAEGVIQLVKYLLCMHEDMGLINHTPVKSTVVIPMLGKWRKVVSEATGQPAQLNWPMRETLPQKQVKS